MATEYCDESVKLCALRVTALTTAGAVAAGPNNSYVTDNTISLSPTGDIQVGVESTLVGGCGQIVATFKDPDRLKRFNLSLVLGTPDPALTSMLLGGSLVLSSAIPVGMSWPINVCPSDTPPPAVAIEAWSYAWSCDHQNPTLPYWYWSFPMCFFSPSNQFTLGNDLLQLDWTGYTRSNPLWGHGPYGSSILFAAQGGYAQVATVPPTAACGFATVTPGS